MNTLSQYASLTYDRCQQLAKISQDPSCMDRRYLTKEHKLSNQQVAQWMQAAGMRTWQDEAGNQWGELTSKQPNAKTLVLGSHLDTVPNGGKYDGIFGVLLPIALLQYFTDTNQTLPFNVQIVGFGDEEGTRFGATLLGSRAVAGTWQQNWANLVDNNNISLAQAMRDFGLDINRVNHSHRSCSIDAFVEIHIEQGPVLEAKNLPVGVVTAIAGAKRFKCSVVGLAGHAGTVPMAMRQDALAGAAEMILAIENIAIKQQVVATVGKLSCLSGATNVISGKTEFSIDVRSENNKLRDETVNLIVDAIESIAQQRKLTLSLQQTHAASAVACDELLQNKLQQAIQACGIVPFSLASGAGHDSMAMAAICPVAMLFMRCDKGISHHPAEAIKVTDIEQTLKVVANFLMTY